MTSVIHYREEIPGSLANERLDRTVALMADVSRSEAQSLVRSGAVAVDGVVVRKPSSRLDVAMVVEFDVPVSNAGPKPDPSIEFAVVHSDPDVIVVNKPPGLIMHHGSGVTSGTLVDGLVSRFPDMANVGPHLRPGLVHRLDKGTSGLVMVARNQPALDYLSEQLRTRAATRRYAALVWGDVESNVGAIDAPLGRSERDATKRAVVATGKEAYTTYTVLDRFVPDPQVASVAVSLVSCSLATGRTHQIRVHMASIGHPVVGDRTYGGAMAQAAPELLNPTDSTGAPVANWLDVERPMLHAGELAFVHPATGNQVTFRADPPADFGTVLDHLRRGQPVAGEQ